MAYFHQKGYYEHENWWSSNHATGTIDPALAIAPPINLQMVFSLKNDLAYQLSSCRNFSFSHHFFFRETFLSLSFFFLTERFFFSRDFSPSFSRENFDLMESFFHPFWWNFFWAHICLKSSWTCFEMISFVYHQDDHQLGWNEFTAQIGYTKGIMCRDIERNALRHI